MENKKDLNQNEFNEQPQPQTNMQYYQNPNIYPQVRYVSQPSFMSIKTLGLWLGVLLSVIGAFIVFAWKNTEERQEYLSGYIIGVLLNIIITIVLFVLYILIFVPLLV